MNDKIPLSKLAIALIILSSIVIGISIVRVEQSIRNEEPYLHIAFLGISMVGMLKVIIGGSQRAAKKD